MEIHSAFRQSYNDYKEKMQYILTKYVHSAFVYFQITEFKESNGFTVKQVGNGGNVGISALIGDSLIHLGS